MNQKKILKRIQGKRDDLRRFGVRRLGLFGSSARGDATKSSDLDFVVEFNKKSFDAYMGLKTYLEDLFHHDVDLVLMDAIKPRLRSTILRQAIYAPGL